MQFMPKHRRKAVINIISLVDVVFLLLIFFTVSATFVDQPALKLDLPEASTEPETAESQEQITVFLTAEGELFFGDRAIRSSDLPELIREGLVQGKESRITIKADREVVHGKVVEIMDLARQSGIRAVTIGTRQAEGNNGE
ncbi:MAG: biopolymer transporter ExbD [Gemmatimonadota bacterium]|nr:biopolymer transporter ExbD [Gemmatimonadota bacterium]